MYDDDEMEKDKDKETGKYLSWLLGKGYADSTARAYDEEMRRVERENLTLESIADIYWHAPKHIRSRLRRAVRLLGEYYG